APVPEAKAAAAAPPSSALIPCSSAWRFGLLFRVYMNPREYVPSASRSNVVERLIGDETAPVAGSMVCPAWTAKVSILIVVYFSNGRYGLQMRLSNLWCCGFGVNSRTVSGLTAPFAQRQIATALGDRPAQPASLFHEYLRRRR